MNRAARFQITTYDDLNEMKADEYAYWQSQPSYARMKAVSGMSREAYNLKRQPANIRRLQRTLVCIER